MAASIVPIDSQSAVGKSIVQISDYATMRLLAWVTDAHVTDDTALPTILSLFTGPSPPSSLTAFDRAYLSGLQRLGTGALSPPSPTRPRQPFAGKSPGR